MSEDQKRALERQLWNIADELRGRMNADEFRDYALGFIFYKYLSEKIYLYANGILASDEITYDQLDETNPDHKIKLDAVKEDTVTELGYFLKPSELFSAVARRGASKILDAEENPFSLNDAPESYKNASSAASGESNFILADLAAILNNIEQSTMGTGSEEDFDNLFEDLDLTSTKLGKTEAQKNELISKILGHLNKIDFKLGEANSDVLGDAYEYLIAQFASGAGKKAGEFYTPQPVSKVLAKIVTAGKSKLKSVYDPTCGSGSLLLRVAKEVKEVAYFYGQEFNRTTYNLARMNMILHGVHYSQFDIKQEDTLERPQHKDMRFEAIVANPPFSAKWSASPLLISDERFSQYGRLAPGSAADFAFVQHMVHHLAENGTMAIVLPHGVLFRGGAEGHIRQYLVADRNYLDAVIGLPPNMFYGTSIPACVLVFKKCREDPENIFFIDGSKEYSKMGNQNYLTDTNIDNIVSTYGQRIAKEKYSYIATLDEVKENDYNLNIPRYVDSFEIEDEIDIAQVAQQLKELEEDIKTTDKLIADYCQQLNIASPF